MEKKTSGQKAKVSLSMANYFVLRTKIVEMQKNGFDFTKINQPQLTKILKKNVEFPFNPTNVRKIVQDIGGLKLRCSHSPEAIEKNRANASEITILKKRLTTLEELVRIQEIKINTLLEELDVAIVFD